MEDTNSEEESLRLAREGNPEFIYEKLYLPSTTKEIPSFKCWKCPTSVDRMDRLECHYLSHGAQKKFKCKFCDFGGDQMFVVLRHEERHRAQKQTKPPASGKEDTPSAHVSTPSPQNTKSGQSERSGHSSESQSLTDYDYERSVAQVQKSAIGDSDEEMEENEVDVESGEEFEVGIESGEEMEIDVGMDEAKLLSLEGHSPALSPAQAIHCNNESMNASLSDTAVADGSSPMDRSVKPQQKNTNKTWNCEFCPASFKFLSLKKRHEYQHSLNGTFACNQCTFSTKTLNSLRNHKLVHDDTNDGRSENSSSPVPSLQGSESSAASVTQGKERLCRQRSTSNPNLVDEEVERARKGNPEFTYQLQYRKSGTKSVEWSTYKCYTCPTSYPALRDLNRHALRHGATDGLYNCRVCDYNHSLKPTFLSHLERHRAQGNIPSHLLDFERIQSKPKGGVDIGDREEVSIIGNENDFEIEYGGPADEESQHEPDGATKKRPTEIRARQLSPVLPDKGKLKTLTPNKKLLAMYDLNAAPLNNGKKARPEEYLLTSMKLSNFMCFGEFSFNLNSDAVTFSGGKGGEGKSTSIIAILLCLGYDVLLEDYTPKVICGWEISDLIRRGREVAKIEICLCLKSHPSLRERFGDELKICRTLRRGVSLSNPTFQLVSERGTIDDSSTLISVQRLRGILKELGILPLYARTLLLDRQNLKAVMSDREYWYEYFVDAVASKGKILKADLEKLNPIFKRLEGDMKWRRTQLKFLKEQLMIDYPVEEDPAFLQWRSEDVRRLRQVEQDLQELAQKHKNLEKLTESHAEDLASVPSVVLQEMRTIYLEFLASQNCLGDILLDENERRLQIWLHEKSSSEPEIPITPAEADDMWGKTPQGKRQLGIFGLYLAFWKVNDTCPFFAVDAFSSAELEFKFPTKGYYWTRNAGKGKELVNNILINSSLPVLMRLVGSKSGQQFLMSYPESS